MCVYARASSVQGLLLFSFSLMSSPQLFSSFEHRLTLLQIKQTCALLKSDGNDELWKSWQELLLTGEGWATINAAWVASHLKGAVLLRLLPQLDALTTRAMLTCDVTLRRLLLTTVLHLLELLLPRTLSAEQAEARLSPTLMELLDFCLLRIEPVEEGGHLPSLCIKLAVVLTRHFPEVQNEVKTLLHLLDGAPCSPALAAAKRNALREMERQRHS